MADACKIKTIIFMVIMYCTDMIHKSLGGFLRVVLPRICTHTCREVYIRDSGNKEPVYVHSGMVSPVKHILCPHLRLRLGLRN
jgi:hypothetical protein